MEFALGSIDACVLQGGDPILAAVKFEPVDLPDYVDISLGGEILNHGLEKFRNEEFDDSSELDQWLAPRIHSALRISRRLAADAGFWTWLTLEIGRPYTWTRWADKKRPTMYRDRGDFKRNSPSRRGWFPEMSRKGPAYCPSEKGRGDDREAT